MEVIFGLLVFAGICYLIAMLCDEAGKASMGEKGWNEFQKAVHEDEKKKKYNNYMWTCPMCGSHEVRKLGTLNRAASISVKGLASDKIGKQYQCDHCGHKF